MPTLTLAQRSQAFEVLPAARLRALTEQLDLYPKDRRSKGSLVEALVGDLQISFTRSFYKPQPLRPLEAIRSDILALEKETEGLLQEILGGGAR